MGVIHYEVVGADGKGADGKGADGADGKDEPLVLLHSGGMSGEEWKIHRRELGKHFRLIIPDLPGHGRTPLGADRLSIALLRDAVLGLLDELKLDKAHVCGSSMGGAVALSLALKCPERVDRLVLYRVGYRKTEAQRAATRGIATPERWVRLGLEPWLSRIHQGQGGPDAWREVIRRVAEAFEPGRTDHDHPLEALAGLSMPTLLICGDRDEVVPLGEVLAMHEVLPDSELWILPGAGHITATNTWRKRIFDEELRRFLGRRRADS